MKPEDVDTANTERGWMICAKGLPLWKSQTLLQKVLFSAYFDSGRDARNAKRLIVQELERKRRSRG